MIGVVDPASVAYWDDVPGTLGPLRERWPIVRSTAGDFEVLRYADVETLLHDHRRMRQALSSMLANQGITDGPLFEWWQLLMNNADVPTHTRLRSLVGRAFTPRRVRELRPRIRAVAQQLLTALRAGADGGWVETDIVAGYCHRLPLVVLCEMLGVPEADIDQFDTWTSAVGSAFSAVLPPGRREEIESALVQFNSYVDELIARRRARPADDLLGALVEAEAAGDRLSPGELRALVINLLFAGHDTTKSLLGTAIWLLASHPDQLARLRADPDLLEPAVEEVARYETPISGIPRIATDDLDVGGFVIPAGSYVTLSVPSANRDPRRFEQPDRFDVGRPDNRHFTFGFGIHHCIGAAVARAEIQEAVGELLSSCGGLEPLVDGVEWVPFAGTRHFDVLPVRLRFEAAS